MREMILASTSPYRQALLRQLKIPFQVQAPNCDEVVYPPISPYDTACLLAERKARSVQTSGELVIGSDQVVDFQGNCIGKPYHREGAIQQLQAFSGHSHRLITAVAVYCSQTDRILLDVDVHTLHMRMLTLQQIERYVDCDQPFDCAGSCRYCTI